MATILGPTGRVTNAQRKAMTTVYLAGPFDEDGGRSWRDEVIDALEILGYLGAKRSNAKRGSSVVVGGDGCDGLVRLFAQNQRLFPVGSDLADVIRIAHIQADEAVSAKADA